MCSARAGTAWQVPCTYNVLLPAHPEAFEWDKDFDLGSGVLRCTNWGYCTKYLGISDMCVVQGQGLLHRNLGSLVGTQEPTPLESILPVLGGKGGSLLWLRVPNRQQLPTEYVGIYLYSSDNIPNTDADTPE